MARIPVYQERQAVSQLVSVPELSAPDTGAGLIGKSMTQVGAALNKVANVAANVQQENSKAWAADLSSKELLHWTQRTEELKGSVAPGGAGYVSSVNQEFQKRADSLIAEAPDDMSRRYLAQSLSKLRDSLLTDALQFEVVEGRAYRANTFKESANNIALAVATKPDPVIAETYIGDQEAIIDSSNLLPKQKQEAKTYLKQSVSVAYWDSIIRKNPAAARVALENFKPVIDKADTEKLYAAVQFTESANNPQAVSEKGAVGLMQVMPETAMRPGFNLPDVFTFAESKGVKVTARNAETAAQLLKDEKIGQAYGRVYLDAMLKRYDNNVVYALAAYNAGPGYVDTWIEGGADPTKLPRETQQYIPKVLERSGITVKGSDNTLLSNLPLSQQLNLLEKAQTDERAQIIESTANAVWNTFGPKSDTDAVEIDVLRRQIDSTMADATPQERETARALIGQYTASFNQASSQRKAARESGVWQQVLNDVPLADIQKTQEWANLDGKAKATLITQINSFRTQPTTPAQTAAYYEMVSNPQELASMTPEQVLVAAGSLGRELGNQLVKDRAKLNTPADVGKVNLSDELFKRYATEAGFKAYTAKSEEEKAKLGELRYKFDTLIQAKQNIIKRELTTDEMQDVMFQVINDKVYVEGTFFDSEKRLIEVNKDDYGDVYVKVGTEVVYAKQIPTDDRQIITRQLIQAGKPVSEQAIADIWLRGQKLMKGQIPQ